jgi:hypothetical protein
MNEYIGLLKKYCLLSTFDANFPLHLCAGQEHGATVTESGLWIYYEEEKQYLRGQEHFLKRLYIRKLPAKALEQMTEASGRYLQL